MTISELIAGSLYYYADFTGPTLLEYLASPDNSPTRYVFWNLGRAQARTLDEVDIQHSLFTNIDDCQTACRSELLRLAGKLEQK